MISNLNFTCNFNFPLPCNLIYSVSRYENTDIFGGHYSDFHWSSLCLKWRIRFISIHSWNYFPQWSVDTVPQRERRVWTYFQVSGLAQSHRAAHEEEGPARELPMPSGGQSKGALLCGGILEWVCSSTPAVHFCFLCVGWEKPQGNSGFPSLSL